MPPRACVRPKCSLLAELSASHLIVRGTVCARRQASTRLPKTAERAHAIDAAAQQRLPHSNRPTAHRQATTQKHHGPRTRRHDEATERTPPVEGRHGARNRNQNEQDRAARTGARSLCCKTPVPRPRDGRENGSRRPTQTRRRPSRRRVLERRRRRVLQELRQGPIRRVEAAGRVRCDLRVLRCCGAFTLLM